MGKIRFLAPEFSVAGTSSMVLNVSFLHVLAAGFVMVVISVWNPGLGFGDECNHSKPSWVSVALGRE